MRKTWSTAVPCAKRRVSCIHTHTHTHTTAPENGKRKRDNQTTNKTVPQTEPQRGDLNNRQKKDKTHRHSQRFGPTHHTQHLTRVLLFFLFLFHLLRSQHLPPQANFQHVRAATPRARGAARGLCARLSQRHVHIEAVKDAYGGRRVLPPSPSHTQSNLSQGTAACSRAPQQVYMSTATLKEGRERGEGWLCLYEYVCLCRRSGHGRGRDGVSRWHESGGRGGEAEGGWRRLSLQPTRQTVGARTDTMTTAPTTSTKTNTHLNKGSERQANQTNIKISATHDIVKSRAHAHTPTNTQTHARTRGDKPAFTPWRRTAKNVKTNKQTIRQKERRNKQTRLDTKKKEEGNWLRCSAFANIDIPTHKQTSAQEQASTQRRTHAPGPPRKI